ncbi:MAG: LysR family transcriptional regulator [Oscillospiraceae bacterium]
MDIKSLEAFLRLSRDKAMSVASSNLFISQQGLSRIIKRMEDELGVTLFVRNNRGVELTQTGKALLEHAEKIVSEYNSVIERIRQSGQQYHGNVNAVLEIGCLPLLTPHPFLQFIEDFPFVELSFGEHRESKCRERMMNGRADISFAAITINDMDFDTVKFFQVESIIYLPQSHPLAEKSVVEINDLQGMKLLLCGSTNYYTIVGDCEQAGVDFKLIMSTTDINITIQCLQSGLGICPFIIGKNRAFPCPDDIVVRPLKLLKPRFVHMMTRKNCELSDTTQLFKDYFINYFRKF